MRLQIHTHGSRISVSNLFSSNLHDVKIMADLVCELLHIIPLNKQRDAARSLQLEFEYLFSRIMNVVELAKITLAKSI